MTSREPNFATALRMVDLLLALDQRHYGWPVSEAAATLEVDPRTVKRYVRALGTRLVTEDGRPAVTIVHRGRQPCIVVTRPILRFEACVLDQAALYLGSCFVKAFLPGSSMEQGLEQLREEVARGAQQEPLAENRTAGHMSQKLAVNPGLSLDTPTQQVLSILMTALVCEQQLLLRQRTRKEIRIVEPLSLCFDGQHWELIVRNADDGQIVELELSSIEGVELGKRFVYPRDWKPPLPGAQPS